MITPFSSLTLAGADNLQLLFTDDAVHIPASIIFIRISGFNKAKRAALRQPFLHDRKNGANYLMSLPRCNLWRNYNKQIPACKSINPTIFCMVFIFFVHFANQWSFLFSDPLRFHYNVFCLIDKRTKQLP